MTCRIPRASRRARARSPGPGRRFLRDSAGAAILEVAVVLPVVVAIMYGVFEIGRAFSTLSDARRELRTATRFLAAVPAAEICGRGLAQARNLAVYGNVDGAGPRQFTGWNTSDIRLEQPQACSDANTPRTVRLAAEIAYTALLWQAIGRNEALRLNLAHEERWRGD